MDSLEPVLTEMRTPRVPRRLLENPDDAKYDDQLLSAGDPNSITFNLDQGKVGWKKGGYHGSIGGRQGLSGRAWLLDDEVTVVSFWSSLDMSEEEMGLLKKLFQQIGRDITKAIFQHAGQYSEWMSYENLAGSLAESIVSPMSEPKKVSEADELLPMPLAEKGFEGITGWWVSPEGEIITIDHPNTHADWAQKYLDDVDPDWRSELPDVEDETDVVDGVTSEESCNALIQRGWVRLALDGLDVWLDESNPWKGIDYQQKSVIRDFILTHGLHLVDERGTVDESLTESGALPRGWLSPEGEFVYADGPHWFDIAEYFSNDPDAQSLIQAFLNDPDNELSSGQAFTDYVVKKGWLRITEDGIETYVWDDATASRVKDFLSDNANESPPFTIDVDVVEPRNSFDLEWDGAEMKLVKDIREQEQHLETIRAAAVRFNDEVAEADSHYDALLELADIGALKPYINSVEGLVPFIEKKGWDYFYHLGAEDGFTTSTGRFVSRQEALKIAVDAGQANPPKPDSQYRIRDWLNSEDIQYESIRFTKYMTAHLICEETHRIETLRFVPGDHVDVQIDGDDMILPDGRWMSIPKDCYDVG